MMSTQIVPTATPPPAQTLHSRAPVVDMGDDEDMSYALRLRQAATSRVFSYVGPTGTVQPAPQVQYPQVVRQASASTMQLSPTGQVQSAGQQQQRPPVARRPRDLLNFQTEV